MHRKLEDLIANVSFVRWLRDEASPAETSYWKKWLRQHPEHEGLVKEARAILVAVQSEEPGMPSPATEWENLDRMLDGNGRDGRLTRFGTPQRNRYGYRKRGWAVAAALMAGICLGLFFMNQYSVFETGKAGQHTDAYPVQEYRTGYGEKVTFRLSDDSRIVLNANSHLRFRSVNDAETNTTEVWLEGEAWFDITRLEGIHRRVFTVHTDDGSVEVVGTRFAVKTLENRTRTVLEKGEVRIHVNRSGQAGQSRLKAYTDGTVLRPGEMAHYTSGREEVAVEGVNPRVYTSWSEDVWFFEDTPLTEIARRIEDTFGVTVVIGEEHRNRRLSGSIKGTDVDVLAEALSKILDAAIERDGQTIEVGTRK